METTASSALTTARAENPSRSRDKWFSGIDSIRFAMAAMVMLGHYQNPYIGLLKNNTHAAARTFGNFLGTAFPGVPAVIAFFIISGFVIHYPNKNGIRDVRKFYIRRYVRVLVPLITIKLASIPFGNPENVVVWSLYCELVYYTIYPLLCRIKGSWQQKIYFAYAAAFIAVALGARSDLLSMISHHNHGYKGEYWELGIPFTWIAGLPCWLLGVRLADEIDSLKMKVSRSRIFAYRTLVYALAVASLILKFHFFVPYLVSMTLISVPLCKWIEAEVCYFKTHPVSNILEKGGKFSYSLYLCHPLIHVLLLLIIPMTVLTYPLYIALAIVGAYVFYLLLEKPSHGLAQRLGALAGRHKTSSQPNTHLEKI